jgi:hypothetical protein
VEEEGVTLVGEGISEISLPRLERGGCLLVWLRDWRAYGLGAGGAERELARVEVLEGAEGVLVEEDNGDDILSVVGALLRLDRGDCMSLQSWCRGW